MHRTAFDIPAAREVPKLEVHVAETPCAEAAGELGGAARLRRAGEARSDPVAEQGGRLHYVAVALSRSAQTQEGIVVATECGGRDADGEGEREQGTSAQGHGSSAARNGFVRRSRPIVVSGP